MTLPPDPQNLAADPKINAFVMANAGSGKTTTLVNRVARLLLQGSRPDAVLCLTFTKAAAAEMQRRLYQALGRWAVAADADLRASLGRLEERPADGYDAEDLSRARSLFARALETPGGLKIQTIHAFCEQLLRRFPVEAGVSPSFRVIDEAEASAVVARAREAVALRSLTGDLPGLSDAYAAMSESLAHQHFEAMFATFEAKRAALAAYVERCGGLAGVPAAVAEAVGLERLDDPDEIEAEAVAALDPARWLWAAAAAAEGNAKTDQPLSIALQTVGEAALRSEQRLEDVRRIFFTADGTPRKIVATKAVDSAVCSWLAEEQARLDEAFDRARTSRVAWNTVHALTLAGVYADEYERAKRNAGVLDFADLIERAKRLLTDAAHGAAWVLYKLDRGVDHMLIDEAQDTSPEQWDIARALTEEFFAGAGARTDGVERTVFVVGDEKQSIFSFQGAAPERLLKESQDYDALITGVGRTFKSIELHTSWRSTAEVLKLVDEVFRPVDLAAALSPGRGRAGDRVDAVVEHRAARADGLGTVDLWPEEKEDRAEERRAWDEPVDVDARRGARRRVAERIVREVRGLVEAGEAVHDKESRAWRPAGWGDVLILVKTRGPMFDEVLRCLKRSGVPVAGADRLKLAEHPVFEDLLAIGRAALYPEDDLNLAAVLRSPLCDVDEAGLFELAHAREKRRLWTVLRERAEEQPAWAEARELIKWLQRESGERTPFDLYGRLLNRRDARGLTQRQRFMTRLGAEAGDAIDAFLDQAHAAEGRGITDLERFCAALSSLDQTVKREMDEPKGEVRVMTAHSAKGLEAPIVILPDTIFEAVRGDPLLETEDGGFLWCSSGKKDCEASAAARALRKRREDEEALRLLYVGLTRARDRLIVGGRLRSDRKIEGVRAWWGPLFDAFTALGPEVREVQTASGTARRYGADPQRLGRGGALLSHRAETPPWVLAEPAEEAGARRAAPSRLQAKGGSSPLETRAGLGRFRRGDLIHKLLELLPDVPEHGREAAARAYLSRQPDLDEPQRAEMAEAALAVLRDPGFAAVFGPGSWPEAAIAGEVEGLPGRRFSARLDRLLVTPERVLVVDFKTNRPAPQRVEDADPAYLKQMAAYVAVLRGVYPDRPVEAALLWTEGPRLTPLPESLVESTLAALRSG
jgi:ATP-dependent helicase/nuclease subunit A